MPKRYTKGAKVQNKIYPTKLSDRLIWSKLDCCIWLILEHIVTLLPCAKEPNYLNNSCVNSPR